MNSFFTLLRSPLWFISFYSILIISIVLPIHYFSSPVRQWKKMIKKYKDKSLFQGKKNFYNLQKCRINYGIYRGNFTVGTNIAGIFFDFSFSEPFFIPWLDVDYMKKVTDEFYELKIEGFKSLVFQLPRNIFEFNMDVPEELIIKN